MNKLTIFKIGFSLLGKGAHALFAIVRGKCGVELATLETEALLKGWLERDVDGFFTDSNC